MASFDLPTKMYAWQGGPGGNKPSKVEVPLPQVDSNGVLIKVLASGVCHSDCLISTLPGAMPGWKEIFTMGHEGCGVIVKLGSGIEKSALHVGQNVAILCTPGCNQSTCSECGRGYQRLCAIGPNPGLGSDGVFAQYVAVKSWAVVPLPDGIPPEIAAVAADAVLTAYHAVKTAAGVQRGDTVIIYGLGGVGFNALQTALYLGARVIVADIRQEVLDEAIKIGVAKQDAICTADGTKVEERIMAEGIVVDSVIDFVGAEQTFLSAQLSLRPAGTLVLIGLMGQQLPLISLPVVMRAIRIQCAYNGTRDELVECLGLIAKGIIHPRVEVGTIEDLPRVLEDLDAGKIKSRMVLMPSS